MAFNYTYRGDDIMSWDVDARDLVESRDRELELYSTTIDDSFLNLNASNLTSGTVPSARMTGAYTGITSVGTLGSLTVTGDLTVDTNTLRVDSTNNRVGINVTTPTSNLDIVGNQVIRAAATQDGIQLAGRAGGTTSLTTKLIPTTLTANRTLTLPDVDGTLITTGNLSSITAVGTLASGSIPATLLTGTIASARISGAYTGITGLGTISSSLTVTGGGGTTITATTQTLINGTDQNSALYLGSGTGSTATGAIEASWRGASNPSIAIGVTRDNNCTKTVWEYGNQIDSFTANTLRTRVNSSGFTIAGTGSLYLSGSTNSALTFANTPDTALPWMQGPVLQGQTGWAFYQAVTGTYRMGFRSNGSGGSRYMWCADNTLLGSAPDDAQITTTLNVIGNMRTTAGYYGTVTYGSYGSLSIYGENGGYVGITFPNHLTTWMSATNGQIFGIYRNNNTWNFYVTNGTFVPSDERYKRDIEPLQHGINLIREIVPVTYDPLTEDPSDDPEQTVGRTHYGFTTQNILQALTNAGETRDIAMVDIGGPDSAMNSDRQYLNHSALIAPMVKAIQELDTRLQQLENP